MYTFLQWIVGLVKKSQNQRFLQFEELNHLSAEVKLRGSFFKNTLQGTNISLTKAILKMIFLFLRWDMLISRRVDGRPHKKAERMCQFYPLDMLVMYTFPFLKNNGLETEISKRCFKSPVFLSLSCPFSGYLHAYQLLYLSMVSNYPSRFPRPFPSLLKKNKSLPIIVVFLRMGFAVTSSPLENLLYFMGFYTTQLNDGGVTNQISQKDYKDAFS